MSDELTSAPHLGSPGPFLERSEVAGGLVVPAVFPRTVVSGEDHASVTDEVGVSARLPDDPNRGLLLALLIGESGQIDKSSWRVLSATGTNHLLIVSGLHVGLVAGLLLVFWQWFLRRITDRWRLLAGVLAFILTLCYAAIAGFGLPVQSQFVYR